MDRRNPYLSTALAKPYVLVDYYLGRKIYHGRYTWGWQARLMAKATGLQVENLEDLGDQDS